MSPPRLSLRWKILLLLAAIALGPVVFIAWTDLNTIATLGSTLAGQSAQALAAQTRANLQQLADSHARSIERQRQLVELVLRTQAREINRALAAAPPVTAAVLWADELERTAAAGGLVSQPEKYFRQVDAATRTPLALSFDQLVFHRVAQDATAPAPDRQGDADARRLATLAPLFRELHDSHPALVYWQYATLRDGLHASYPAHAGYPANYDPRTRIWYERQRARQTLDWSPPHTDVSTRLAMVSATMPLWTATGEFAGVTGIDVRVTQLLQPLSLPRHIAKTGQVLVTALTQSGVEPAGLQVIARNDHLDVGDNWEDIRHVEWLRFEREQETATIAADMREGRDGIRTVNLRGQRTYCVFRRIGANGLYLVFLVPAQAAIRPAQDAADYALTTTRRQQDALLLIACTVTGLVFLLSLIASRAITGPIGALERAVAAVARGDFSTRVHIATGDELEALGDSFNAMIPQLAEHTRVQKSLAVAREVQQQLLPREAPVVEGIDIAGLSLYCDETGGDYFDFLDLRNVGRQAVGAVVGDVSGHGVAAALLMATARALLHGALTARSSPSEIVAVLNRHLAADVRPGYFMTLFAIFIDLEERSFSWSSAGHDPALWWHAASGTITEMSGEDIPLAIDLGWDFHPSTVARFAEGDIVLIATDGLWETKSEQGNRFGKSRMREILREHHARPAAEIARAVSDAAAEFRGHAPQRDDLTVVTIRIGTLPA